MTPPKFDAEKFDQPLQVGGIRTGRYDWPDAGGGPGCRVAFFETGTPLRFVVNLDRGGDIVEAWHGGTALAYLTPNGYAPPGTGGTGAGNADRWTRGWNGGLVSTCGPRVIGRRTNERGEIIELHGAYHHSPAAVVALRNPDVRAGQREMSLELVVRDAQLFGPVLENRRTLTATLGEPALRLRDTVTNLGNTAVEHHWLYHCNLGYPLLDAGAELIYAGTRDRVWGVGGNVSAEELAAWKRVPAPLPTHQGDGERGVIINAVPAPAPGSSSGRSPGSSPGNPPGPPPPDAPAGHALAAVINPQRSLGVAIRFDPAQLPRLAHWQHYGPRGSYVTALEPFNGSLLGLDNDDHPRARVMLEPGESRRYDLRIDTTTDPSTLGAWRDADRPVTG